MRALSTPPRVSFLDSGFIFGEGGSGCGGNGGSATTRAEAGLLSAAAIISSFSEEGDSVYSCVAAAGSVVVSGDDTPRADGVDTEVEKFFGEL
jgi:hypothetical protein